MIEIILDKRTSQIVSKRFIRGDEPLPKVPSYLKVERVKDGTLRSKRHEQSSFSPHDKRNYLFRRLIPGLGDAVMMEPAIRATAEVLGKQVLVKFPGWIAPIFEHHPSVAVILDNADEEPVEVFPVLDIASPASCPAAKYEAVHTPRIRKPRHQIFLEAAEEQLHLKLKLSSPKLYLSEEEREEANRLKSNPWRNIGIQYHTAESWRDYPHMSALVKLLCKAGYEVYIFALKDLPFNGQFHIIKRRPIREVMVMLAGMHLVLGPDSGLLHLAGALNVPILSLFGPTDAKIRLKAYSSWKGNMNASCPYKRHPCWYQPCQNVTCLDELQPEKILKRVRKLVRRR